MRGGPGRAVKVRHDNQDRCEDCPRRSPREGEQREGATGRNGGGNPPELTLKKRGGFGSGQFWRQTQAGRDRKERKSGQAPREPVAPIDLAAAEREPGRKQKCKTDSCQCIGKQRIDRALDTVLRLPGDGVLVRLRRGFPAAFSYVSASRMIGTVPI
jgi:hypothetical protein